MSSRSNGEAYESESVVPFAPKNAASNDADQLDRAGQTILQLLQKAAGVAEENSKHALDMAQELSHQLRATEDRVAELDAEVQLYRDKADRAGQWLHKVCTEIEERFIRQAEEKRRVSSLNAAGRRA
jgi:molecular chaperone GrpE (heat shock protein)